MKYNESYTYFQIYGVTCSYSSRPFLCALASSILLLCKNIFLINACQCAHCIMELLFERGRGSYKFDRCITNLCTYVVLQAPPPNKSSVIQCDNEHNTLPINIQFLICTALYTYKRFATCSNRRQFQVHLNIAYFVDFSSRRLDKLRYEIRKIV